MPDALRIYGIAKVMGSNLVWAWIFSSLISTTSSVAFIAARIAYISIDIFIEFASIFKKKELGNHKLKKIVRLSYYTLLFCVLHFSWELLSRYFWFGKQNTVCCLTVFCFIGSDALPLVDMYGLEGLREIINCTLKIDKCHMFHKVR